MNAQWVQFLKVISIQLILICAPSAEPVLMFAQAALLARLNATRIIHMALAMWMYIKKPNRKYHVRELLSNTRLFGLSCKTAH